MSLDIFAILLPLRCRLQDPIPTTRRWRAPQNPARESPADCSRNRAARTRATHLPGRRLSRLHWPRNIRSNVRIETSCVSFTKKVSHSRSLRPPAALFNRRAQSCRIHHPSTQTRHCARWSPSVAMSQNDLDRKPVVWSESSFRRRL